MDGFIALLAEQRLVQKSTRIPRRTDGRYIAGSATGKAL